MSEYTFGKNRDCPLFSFYILYVLAGGAEGRSCYGAKALKEATSLASATICKARQELQDLGLIITQKEMISGRKNKKPKIWVELQDLPVDRVEIKQRRATAHKEITIKKVKKRRTEFIEQEKLLCERPYIRPAWLKEAFERAKRQRKERQVNV